MAGWQIFAAIVLAVLMPVGGALLVYQTALLLSYDTADVISLLKIFARIFATVLVIIFMVVFCGSFDRRSDSVSDKRKK